MTISTGNEEYLGSSLLNILTLSMVPFLSLSLLIYLLARTLIPRDQKIFVYFLSSLFLLTWFQSQVLVWDYGALTGESIAWDNHKTQKITELLVWTTTAGVLILLYRRLQLLVRMLALTLAVLQVAIAAALSAPQMLAESAATKTESNIAPLSAFSSEHNIIHIVIDGFQSDILEDLLTLESTGERYTNHLTGFTFFRETLGVFPYTQFSVPAYLTTEVYSNEVQKEAFIDDTLSGTSVISVAKDNDYKIDIAMSGSYFIRRHSHLPHDTMIDIDALVSPDSDVGEVTMIWDIGIFRAVPHFLKPFVYNEQQWLISGIMADDAKYSYKYFAHTDFLNRLTQNMNVGRAKPTYKLIHVHQTHRPMVVNQNCDFSGGILPDTRFTLGIQTACTMQTLIYFLEQLKELDLYDGSLILIHADHGGWVPTLRDGAEIFVGDNAVPRWTLSLASPLFMVKPPHAEGDLRVSDALTSLLDIPDTVSDIMQWDMSFGHHSAMLLDEDYDRERRFRFYFWDENEWNNDFTRPIYEFSIKGSHFDTDWELIDVHAPEDGLAAQ